ncbi:MAG: tetratricopeptide repeat protein [Flavobacteriales bacterium]
MNEGPSAQPERDDLHDCVERYEAMCEQNAHYFFDVEEFEIIIEHYLEESDAKRANEVLGYARQQHPGSQDLMFCEAHVLMSMGKLNRALEVLDAIEKMEPYNEDIQLHKASIYSQLRNYRRAVEHYKRALELAEEGLDDIHLDLAFEYENLEAFDLAIESLQQALEMNPENEAVLYELAYCYDLADGHQAAVSFFRNFTNEHPYSFVAWYNLGNALARWTDWMRHRGPGLLLGHRGALHLRAFQQSAQPARAGEVPRSDRLLSGNGRIRWSAGDRVQLHRRVL